MSVDFPLFFHVIRFFTPYLPYFPLSFPYLPLFHGDLWVLWIISMVLPYFMEPLVRFLYDLRLFIPYLPSFPLYPSFPMDLWASLPYLPLFHGDLWIFWSISMVLPYFMESVAGIHFLRLYILQFPYFPPYFPYLPLLYEGLWIFVGISLDLPPFMELIP